MPNDEYQWDTIESYRLNKDIINKFLQKTFGYCEYFTEVRHLGYLNKGSFVNKRANSFFVA